MAQDRNHSLFALLFSLLFAMSSLLYADGVHPDPGHLQQTVLVILRFPPQGVTGELTPADEQFIATQLKAVSDFLWANSNQSLQVNFAIVKILQSVAASEYECYPGVGCAATFDTLVQHSLADRLIDARQYAGVIMIYRPTNTPQQGLFYNTWICFNDQLGGPCLNPGYSAILYNYNGTPPLSQYILHEYLHQLHHRFQYMAHNSVPAVDGLASFGFIDSDWMTTPGGPPGQLSTTAKILGDFLGTAFQPGDDVPWLSAILKYYVGPIDKLHPRGSIHAVNYRHLEGRYPDNVVLGAYYGGELKTEYNFANSDDLLVYIAGDNITFITTTSEPASFWFRALPGNTAAFGTQTGFGLYLLNRIAFNYEIAPDDYTFEVHLIYYDVHNPTTPIDVRIDDGEYVLGRQKFSTNRKIIDLVPREVEDFQIVLKKGNQLNGAAANDDWAIVGNITLSATPAP